ncbi:MAG: Oxidoreductase, FAD-binding [uncultured Sphingosinicella sp.]|uniref:Oxidoreductase, FAD-binding n=1 Tax=uncultured Sphingosinicella sp. TaxID=478748 RepID=A0A6J4TGI5_9SPHN|nr:FAD-dependent oxidoreductase [uncultured Sphingosinicella sp.]CAA9522782.1 MAG: Oxidoreductase, FAD-binding [uncultured Sphingosinicella sp.]
MKFDVAIIGAGMAAASLAAELAPHLSVAILEAESHAGYHSTGRSAAFWSETYGGPLIQPLTSASAAFLAKPPAGFGDGSFLRRRRSIHVAQANEAALLDIMLAEFEGSVELQRLDRPELERSIPGLLPGWDEGVLEPTCADIDVAALHQAYLGSARRAGAQIMLDAPLGQARRSNGWRLETAQREVEAAILVNAAGAWADHVAELGEVAAVGVRPYRRTISQLRIDPPVPAELPLIIDALGRFYFKPEAGGRLWLSPHDETPCEACDSAPEEYDVALAIDRLSQIVDWRVERVEHSWAGLRSFAPDRLPVYGFADERRDFFWCAGQGGFGIQTAPAAAKLAAALLLGIEPDPMVAGIDPAPYLATRFTN